MRIGRLVIIIVVVAVIGLLALFLYSSIFSSGSSGPWVGGQDYPLQVGGAAGVVGQSCLSGPSTIYCIGGIDYNGASRNNVYSAATSSSGLSGWTSDTAYPQTVGLQSCVAVGGYAYCIGGSYDDAGDDIASSYYAPLTGTGVGSWDQTTSYPVAIDSQACVPSSGYVYCVGGENETDGTNSTLIPSDSAWYASLSSNGIGAWKHTTAYPSAVSFEACAATSADIFCVGGTDINDNGVSNVYYAPLSSGGIGEWSSTNAYPAQLYGQTCLIDSGTLVCIGGVPNGTTSSSVDVYTSTVSSDGVGQWHHAPNYPMGVETACASAAGNVYCSGGYQDSSSISAATYYVSLQSLTG